MSRITTLTIAAGTLIAAACTGTDKTPVDSATTGASVAAAPIAPAVVTVTAKDYSYEAPDTITAGMTTLRLVNQGKELHHIQLVRLD